MKNLLLMITRIFTVSSTIMLLEDIFQIDTESMKYSIPFTVYIWLILFMLIIDSKKVLRKIEIEYCISVSIVVLFFTIISICSLIFCLYFNLYTVITIISLISSIYHIFLSLSIIEDENSIFKLYKKEVIQKIKK